MNTRKTKKAVKRMCESPRLWDLYSHKKFSKCWLRNRRKLCAEKNRQLEAEGSPYRAVPYIMKPLTSIVGNWCCYKSVATRYAKKMVNNNFYATFKIDDKVIQFDI